MGVLTPAQAVSLYGGENPFQSAAALRDSNYCGSADGKLVRLLDWREPSAKAQLADAALRGFLNGNTFSCVAAKAALASGGYRFGYYRDFATIGCAEGLARDLAAFVAERPSMPVAYATFVAVFEESNHGGEAWFEAALWRQLQRLAELSAGFYPWAAGRSSDPNAADFSFSFAKQAFFVVGMHPSSSRLSRRFFLPALAFNAHEQFERARRNGNFGKIQRVVRSRELALQGSINPELSDFGRRTEARQYSGKPADEEWRCPFRPPA